MDIVDDFADVSHLRSDAARREHIIGMMRENILARYRQADPATLASGREWYGAGLKLAKRVGRGDVMRGAAIVAILSPRRSWAHNVALALAVGRGEAIATMGDQVRKLERLSVGEHPNDVVGGRKVRSFWQNLQGITDAVTVDVWALRAALDGDIGDDDSAVVRKLFGSDYGYAMVADAYREAAEVAGETPSAMQAIVWIVVRGSAS